MEKFEGKWKLNPDKNTNYDAFAKNSGVQADLIEKFRKDVATAEFKVNGDKMVVTMWSDAMPDPKMYKITLGEELKGKDMLGKDFKLTMTKESDDTLLEVSSSEITGWKVNNTKRQVKGNKMFAIVEIEGVQMTQEWDKI